MKIRLSYWLGMKNLGDALSPFIVSELSGKKVSHFNSDNDLSVKTLFKRIRLAVVQRKFIEICYIVGSCRKHLMAIGSILESANKETIVWGTGFITANGKCKAKSIHAVRGRYTERRLNELGFDTSGIVCGDPALLLPLIINPAKKKKYLTGVIPHWRETDDFISQYGKYAHVIDIRTDDIKAFVEELTSCEYILSSSLHGIIIAHAYGIPALLIEKKEEKEYGYFKYNDYFSSVGIESGEWVNIDRDLPNDRQRLESLFEKYAGKALPQVDICTIQKNLLNTAPFPLKKKYKQYVR